MIKNIGIAALCAVMSVTAAAAQTPAVGATSSSSSAIVPAASFGSRRGVTRLEFQGTGRMPLATGEARVEARKGFTRIDAKFTDLQNPTVLGHEFLTYIMWAISPDGRAANLGEVQLPAERNVITSLLPGNRSSLTVTTPLQTFALIVTAEPYYAVRAPSDAVILLNVVVPDITPINTVDARLDTVERGYTPTGFTFDPVLLRTNLPLDFFQARNAMRIAEGAGAETYAADTYATAKAQLGRAEGLAAQKRLDKRALMSVSREVVQTAEDAREAGARRMQAERLEEERRAAARREADARAQAQLDAERRQKAEAERTAAEGERRAAERLREEAERARQEALTFADEAARARAEAESRRAAALRLQQEAEAEAARTRAEAIELDARLQQVMRDREDLRADLLRQLNLILETRDTARGLIVNLSDVTFATGQSVLQPGAREKLARVSGILAAHPTLRADVEGHTDSVGGDEYNQGLSERRAEAVRNYLIQQGVSPASISAAGFGKTRPAATNDTPEGRQLNRRVELVVSGETIGK